MLPFLETPRFNTDIRYGTIGGPEFKTDIVTVDSGAEQRNVNWLDSRGYWELGGDTYTRKECDTLIAFFRERRGRAGGFRFKDWSDFKVARTEGVLTPVEGSTTLMQLEKRYSNGTASTYRKITKPVEGTVVIYDNSGNVLASAAVDYVTGQVTIAQGQQYSWEGEFDVPVRFDADRFNCTFEGYRDADGESLFSISNLPVVEIRDYQTIAAVISVGGTGGSAGGGVVVPVGPGPDPATPTSVGPLGGGAASEYTLTFSDEFNGASLDSARWVDHDWTQDNGDALTNYLVAGGFLKIWPETTFVNRTITTDGIFYQNYGFFEMSARMPTGLGVWPLAYLYNHDSTTVRPEIDFMEAFPGDGTEGYGDASQHPVAYMTRVWPGAAGNVKGELQTGTDDLSLQQHTYGVKWEPTKVTFYYDGAVVNTVTASINARLYLTLALWFGGKSGTPLAGTTPTGAANSLEIDYIRVWAINSLSSGDGQNLPTNIPPTGQLLTAFTLTYQDEFNAGTVPDMTYWTTDLYYKEPNATPNFDISSGVCNLWPQVDSSNNFFDRTVCSGGLVAQRYGYFEVKAKLPIGAGLHPFISLMNTNGSEIKLVSAYTGRPSSGYSTADLQPNNFAFGAQNNSSSIIGSQKAGDTITVPDLSADFHTFAVKWDSTSLTFFFDGTQVGTPIAHNTLDYPMFWAIGLWTDTQETTPTVGSGTVSSGNQYTPQGASNALQIDYVRMWNINS